jgi:hypothetical protein
MTPLAAVLAQAIKRKVFARVFRKNVMVPDDLAALVERLMVKEALDTLSLANKAGLVVAGAAKVEAALAKKGQVIALFHASDGSEDGLRKLVAAVARHTGDPHSVPVLTGFFDSDQMDMALGRTNVVHMALTKGSLGGRCLALCERLAHWREGPLS